MRRLVGPAGRLDWLGASVGALVGLGLTAFICRAWLGTAEGLPYLIAPMGASAVLLFAVPASPLARPWALFGGSLVSALVGIVCGRLIGDPVVSGAVAVAAAILAMRATQCLHPPGGAVALVAATGGPAIHAAGWSFALVPVALNAALLLGLGWLVNNALGHRYPHRAPPPAPAMPGHYSRADVEAVLARSNELIDVSVDDLEQIFRQVEAEAASRVAREKKA